MNCSIGMVAITPLLELKARYKESLNLTHLWSVQVDCLEVANCKSSDSKQDQCQHSPERVDK